VTTPDLSARLSLIVIVERTLAAPRNVYSVVQSALDAGAPAVQLRNKGDSAAQQIEAARTLRAMTRKSGALLFVNDRLDVALAAEADGVHLGPNDIPVAAARAMAPRNFLIGRSADEPAVARQAVRDGASYIGCGTVYATSTKTDAGGVIGLDGLQRVAESVSAPVVGIGGITVERVREVLGAGAAGVAVVGAVMAAKDPGEAVRRIFTARDS
jgi:thiamine-phosphate diphosphorylase